jgi:hypothetical protein
MKGNIMKSYLKLGALCVAILVLVTLNLIFTILDMALGLVKKAIGLVPFHFAQCIIKMVDTESRSMQVKKHLKKSMDQNQNFYDKL